MIWKLVWTYAIGKGLLAWIKREKRDDSRWIQPWMDRTAARGGVVRLGDRHIVTRSTIRLPPYADVEFKDVHVERRDA
jgi:hypothetical protein